ncbi:MAG: TetR family transcriptional regulator [Bryobacteraceae bacterium]
MRVSLEDRGAKNGEPTKHQQRTETTRRALLEAAKRIFARDGFEAARIEDIAGATGHTRGAFYAHFNHKEDLFFALFEQEAGERLRDLRSAMERCPDSGGRMRALRKFYVGRASDRQWVMLSLEFKLFAFRHPKLRARLARTHRRIRESLKLETIGNLIPELLQDGQELREVRRVALEAVLNGLVLERAYDPETISQTQASAVLGRMFDVLMAAKQRAANGSA